MLNIPENVKIGWRNYTVAQGEHRAGDNGGDLYGQIEYEKRQIFLYEKIDTDEKSVTLLHEMLHGIFFNMGNALREDENFVTALAENLYQVIKENPEIFLGGDTIEKERHDEPQNGCNGKTHEGQRQRKG